MPKKSLIFIIDLVSEENIIYLSKCVKIMYMGEMELLFIVQM